MDYLNTRGCHLASVPLRVLLNGAWSLCSKVCNGRRTLFTSMTWSYMEKLWPRTWIGWRRYYCDSKGRTFGLSPASVAWSNQRYSSWDISYQEPESGLTPNSLKPWKTGRYQRPARRSCSSWGFAITTANSSHPSVPSLRPSPNWQARPRNLFGARRHRQLTSDWKKFYVGHQFLPSLRMGATLCWTQTHPDPALVPSCNRSKTAKRRWSRMAQKS